MRLFGRLIKGTRLIKQEYVLSDDENSSFRDTLEGSLIGLCKKLDIQVPIWLKRNTTEFASYHKTFFAKDQFVENVDFDRFEIDFEQ